MANNKRVGGSHFLSAPNADEIALVRKAQEKPSENSADGAAVPAELRAATDSGQKADDQQKR